MKNDIKTFRREISFMECVCKVSGRERGCEFLDFEADKSFIQLMVS